MSNVLVVGMGYVGLPIAVRAAEAGHTVIGVDVSDKKIAAVCSGRSYVEDVSDDRLAAVTASGALSAHLIDRPHHFDIALITVPTPVDEIKAPDLRFIESAAEYVASCMRGGETVVLESTTYPGTTEDVVARTIHRITGFEAERDYHLGYSPERINPGDPVHTFQNVPKIVSGTNDEALHVIKEFYDTLVDRTVPVSSPRAAELAKVFENTFAQVNIALVNELALVCSEIGLDIDEVLDAAATKGHAFMRFRSGIGVGGHCQTPGTLILTEHGMRPIELIKVGDRVVASDGRLHPVLKTFVHDYDGEVATVRARGLLPVTMTVDHKVPVAADGRPAKRGRKHHPVDGKSTVDLLGPIEIKHAGDIVPGTDFIYWPLIEGGEDVAIPEHASNEYVRLAGWYLSEGTTSGKMYADGSWVPTRVGFGFHVDEVDYHAEVTDLAERVGSKYPRAFNASGVRIELDHAHNRGNVFYGSRPLAEQLIADFGRHQQDRAIPSWLLFGPAEWVPMVLRGLLCGDGMLRRSIMTFGTTSETLAYGVMVLLNRMDIHATIATGQSRDRRRAWYVDVRGTETLTRLYDAIEEADIVGDPKAENIQYPERDGKVFRPVQSVEIVDYVGPVHNLMVDEDHTYLTSGALVNNCISIDPLYLTWMRRTQHGKAFKFAELADEINSYMPTHTMRRTRELLKARNIPVWKSRILVLGAAYKPGVADIRESPAVEYANLLRDDGATVLVADPHVWPDQGADYASRMAGQVDLVVIATAHREFDYEAIRTAAVEVLDTRNCYPRGTKRVHKL